MTAVSFLDIKSVCERTSLSKTHVYRLIGQGLFPKPVQLSVKRHGWVASEIDQWCEQRINDARRAS